MAQKKTLQEQFPLNRETVVNDLWLNNLLRVLEARLSGIELKATDFDEATADLLQVGLARINEIILPALEQVRDMIDLGFLTAPSQTAALLVEGATTVFTIPPGTQRDLFIPSTFVMLSRDANINDYAVLRTVSYDKQFGEYVGTMISVRGAAGPFADWTLGALAGSSIAQLQMLADAIDARDVAVAAAGVAVQKAEDASDDADAVQANATAVATSFDAFKRQYWGARNTPPPTTAGTAENGRFATAGAFYLDTAITPATVKVYNGTAWAPAVSVSIGGSRMQVYAPTNGQTVFTVDGGYSSGKVNVNGANLYGGKGVTLNPGASTFTLDSGVLTTDIVVFEGYLANNALDIYTKQEIDNGFFTKTYIGDNYPTKTAVASGYYSKAYIDANFYGASAIDNGFYTKTASDGRYYTKTAVDTALGGKQNYNDNLRDLSLNPTGTNKVDLLYKLGPAHGGEAPEPQSAGVGMAMGDFNTITVPGVYTIAGVWNNGPSGNATHTGVLIVHARRFNNGFWQEYLYNGNKRMRRSSGNGTTWSAWESGNSEMVGTVSQNGGVPTGAIVERGSNANGDYVKFADGTMMAWKRVSHVAAVADWTQLSTAVPLFFLGTTEDWIFPISFVGTPVVSCTSDYFTMMRSASGFNGTKCRFEPVRETAQARTYNFAYSAIGRWF